MRIDNICEQLDSKNCQFHKIIPSCSINKTEGAFGYWMRASHPALYAIIELETQCYSIALGHSTLG